MATKKNQVKLRPLIHKSYTYFFEKLHEDNHPLSSSNVGALKEMVDKVEEAAATIYPTGLPDGFRYAIDDVNYVLKRLGQAAAGEVQMPKDDVLVFADALESHFDLFLDILDEVDEGQR